MAVVVTLSVITVAILLAACVLALIGHAMAAKALTNPEPVINWVLQNWLNGQEFYFNSEGHAMAFVNENYSELRYEKFDSDTYEYTRDGNTILMLVRMCPDDETQV